MAGFYAVYHGPERLRIIAERTHRLTAILGAGLRRLGFKVANRDFFDTLTVELDGGAAAIHRRARKLGINLRGMGRKTIGIALDETTEPRHVEDLWRAFAGRQDTGASVAKRAARGKTGIREGQRRRPARSDKRRDRKEEDE